MNENINTKDMPITPEMEEYFKGYVHSHVNGVCEFARILFDLHKIDQDLFDFIRFNHDKSKFEEPEYTPYVKRKWLERNSNKDFYDDMGEDVKRAIVHHVTTNAHHPECWSDDYQGFEVEQPCHVEGMPEACVVEMVCDWEAMAKDRGNTARSWYDKTRDTRWIFDAQTNALIDKWLKVFESLGY